MPFFGDMTFDTSGSDIDFTILSVHGVTDDDYGHGILVLYGLTANDDYRFWIDAPAGTYGTYTVRTYCRSDAPTKSPTEDPTADPTADPTLDPTSDPTEEPTYHPSEMPTSPTIEPTREPTQEPTEYVSVCYSSDICL